MVAKDVRKIERIALTHVDDVEANLRGDVLRRAETLFGYVAESFNAAGPLAKALAELNIQPLDTAQVFQYMESKKKTWNTHYRLMGHLTASLLPVIFSIIARLVIWKFHLQTTGDILGTAGTACIVAGILSILSLFFGNAAASDIKDYKYERIWQHYSLGEGVSEEEFVGRNNHRHGIFKYERYIPIHVLNLAVSVKELVPKATFFVDELQQTYQRIPRPLPDPFLQVKLAGESYYIAVWDEREFEAKQ